MVKAFIVAIVIAAGSAIASSAYAADACVDANNPWTCFGVLDFKLPVAGQDRVARMIRYSNGEIMFEIENANSVQRALVVLPAGIEFFSGLQGRQDLDVRRNPFTFIDQGFNTIIALLLQSFPAGPQSATASGDATVELEGDASAHVILQRIDSQTLRFQAVITGGRQLTAIGTFKQGLIPSLPNSFSLKEWLSKEEGIKTLAAARSRKRPAASAGK